MRSPSDLDMAPEASAIQRRLAPADQGLGPSGPQAAFFAAFGVGLENSSTPSSSLA